MKKPYAVVFFLLCAAGLMQADSYYSIDGFEVVSEKYTFEQITDYNSGDGPESFVISEGNNYLVTGEVVLFPDYKREQTEKDLYRLIWTGALDIAAGDTAPGDYNVAVEGDTIGGIRGYWVLLEINGRQLIFFAADIRRSPGFGGVVIFYGSEKTREENEALLIKVLSSVQLIFHMAAG